MNRWKNYAKKLYEIWCKPHHVLGKEKAERVARLLDLHTREQMEELEAGQYFGPSIFPCSSINILR